MRSCALQLGVGVQAIGGQVDLHAMALQGADQAVSEDSIVFDEQDMHGE